MGDRTLTNPSPEARFIASETASMPHAAQAACIVHGGSARFPEFLCASGIMGLHLVAEGFQNQYTH